jgi:hypothetical protein
LDALRDEPRQAPLAGPQLDAVASLVELIDDEPVDRAGLEKTAREITYQLFSPSSPSLSIAVPNDSRAPTPRKITTSAIIDMTSDASQDIVLLNPVDRPASGNFTSDQIPTASTESKEAPMVSSAAALVNPPASGNAPQPNTVETQLPSIDRLRNVAAVIIRHTRGLAVASPPNPNVTVSSAAAQYPIDAERQSELDPMANTRSRPRHAIIHVDKTPCVAFVDSGADVCVMDSLYFKRLPDTLKALAQPPDERINAILRDVSGHPLALTAILRCPVGFPERKVAQEIYVVSNLVHPFIVGINLISDLHWILDFKKARITCPAHGTQKAVEHTLFDASSPETHLARLSKTLVLPAHSQTIVEVDLHPQFHGRTDLVLCPRHDRSSSLAVPHTLVDAVVKGRSPPRAILQVTNFASKRLSLPRGAVVAYVAPDPDAIVTGVSSVLAINSTVEKSILTDQRVEDDTDIHGLGPDDDEIAQVFDERHDHIMPSSSPPPFATDPTVAQRHQYVRDNAKIDSALSDTQRDQILDLLLRHHTVVSVNKELGRTATAEHRIEVGQAKPFATPPRRYAPPMQKAADKIIDVLERWCP